VLVNLMRNAIDALEGTGSPHIEVCTRVDDGWRLIEVGDNGPGIAAEHLARVFEPFFTTKPVGQGTGLGLSISFSLVQRHGGSIEVRSGPGQGARFCIRLPPSRPAEGGA
jgi:signal transduction histidine kinase